METDINIGYDRNIAARVNVASGTLLTTLTPSIYKDNAYAFNVTLYDDWPTLSNCAGYTTLKTGIGKLGEATPPLLEIDDGDHDKTFANVGSIIIHANAHSVALDTDLGTASQKTYYLELNGNDGDDNTIMLIPLIVKNTVYNS